MSLRARRARRGGRLLIFLPKVEETAYSELFPKIPTCPTCPTWWKALDLYPEGRGDCVQRVLPPNPYVLYVPYVVEAFDLSRVQRALPPIPTCPTCPTWWKAFDLLSARPAVR